MSRRFSSLTETDIEWLKANRKRRVPEIANYLGVCVDSAKRWMLRLKIADEFQFPGAKYQGTIESTVVMWERPCTQCKSTVERPKWQYFCDPCKVRLGHDMGDNPFDPDESPHKETPLTTQTRFQENNNQRVFR